MFPLQFKDYIRKKIFKALGQDFRKCVSTSCFTTYDIRKAVEQKGLTR